MSELKFFKSVGKLKEEISKDIVSNTKIMAQVDNMLNKFYDKKNEFVEIENKKLRDLEEKMKSVEVVVPEAKEPKVEVVIEKKVEAPVVQVIVETEVDSKVESSAVISEQVVAVEPAKTVPVVEEAVVKKTTNYVAVSNNQQNRPRNNTPNNNNNNYAPRNNNTPNGNYAPRNNNTPNGNFAPRNNNTPNGNFAPRNNNTPNGNYPPRTNTNSTYNNNYAPRTNTGTYNNNNTGNNNNSFNRNTVGARPAFPRKPGFSSSDPVVTKPNTSKTSMPPKKKAFGVEERKGINKRTLIRKGYIASDYDLDGEEINVKTRRNKQINKKIEKVNITNAVITSEFVSIKVLSDKIGKTGSEIIKKLFLLGIVKTINDSIDFETADLVASELGIGLEYKPDKTYEDVLQETVEEEIDVNLVGRPPVVTIMGHVDHGKTSLLDFIRKTSVASGEAGGITQHIGAYTINLDGKPITFLDTPGHEAFTSMRMRGAQVTDVAIIVVAADDGIMPQTIEAINHAKLAKVEIVIAINKIDRIGANPDRIKQQMTEYNLLPEEWGGDIPVRLVSAKTGDGVSELLETVLLVAEMQELKANPNRLAKGIIIEARLDKGRGPVATILVQNGTLNVSDYVVAGACVGKIRSMFNSKGQQVKTAGPSMPVSVTGFSEVPAAGDIIMAVENEKLSKQVAEERKNKERVQPEVVKMNLEDIFSKISAGEIKDLNLIIKADVQGSVEAVKQSMEKIVNEEAKVKIIHSAVGAVNESDVVLAQSASAIIIAFNVRPDTNARLLAERNGQEIRTYRVIYEAIDDVEKAIKGMLTPKFKEVVEGNAEVRLVYKVSNIGTIAGCKVTNGKLSRSSKVRLLRNGVIIVDTTLASLKRFKDDAKEVLNGFECGLSLTDYNDIKEGDILENYFMEEIVDG